MFDTPGVLSATHIADGNLLEQYEAGIDWHAVQLWNDGPRLPAMFPALPVGMKRAAWGVTYRVGDFRYDGEQLALAALQSQVEGMIIDGEQVLAGPEGAPAPDPRPLIEGLSKFSGPKALTTMGSTTVWNKWTFNLQIQPWLDAGYWILPQAYFNEEDFFGPWECFNYWTRVGVPVNRINLMIGTHRSAPDKGKPNLRLSGADYALLLSTTPITNRRAISIFLASTTFTEDYKALSPWLSRPPVLTSPRQEAIDTLRPLVQAWAASGMSQQSVLRQRVGFALRVLEMDLPTWYGPMFTDVDKLIAELLDH